MVLKLREPVTMRHILQSILAVLMLLLLIPTLVIILPLLAIRLVISTWAKISRPDLDGMVSGTSAVFSSWPSFNLVFGVFVDGDISVERNRFLMEKVLSQRKPNGDYLFKKFKQTWTYFCGFTFWKNESDFRLENHVRDYDYEGDLKLTKDCTEDDATRMLNRLLEVSWKEGQSPWEALIVPVSQGTNKGPRTLFMIRHHHALFDGYSAINLLKVVAETDFQLAKPITFKRKPIGLEDIVRVPYDLAGVTIDNWDLQHDWHIPRNGDRREFHSSIFNSIPVELIKEAKNKLGVTYVAVLFSIVGGGIQGIFKEAQLPVPEYLTTVIPIPKPNHPGGLTNHMSVCPFKWPVKAASASERTQKIQEQFNHMAQSITTGLLFLALEAMGLTPSFAQRILSNFFTSGGSILASCFPVPDKPSYYDGYLISSLHAKFGMPGNTIGTSILMVGINGDQGIAVTMDKRIFPSEKIFQRLGDYVERELRSLLPNSPKLTHNE